MQQITELPSGMSSPYLKRLDGLKKTSEKLGSDPQTQETKFRIRVDGQEMTFEKETLRQAKENRLQNILSAESCSHSRSGISCSQASSKYESQVGQQDVLSNWTSSSSEMEETMKIERYKEIEQAIAQWQQSNEYKMLSDECRNGIMARMRKEKYSAFYIQLSELTHQLYQFHNSFYPQIPSMEVQNETKSKVRFTANKSDKKSTSQILEFLKSRHQSFISIASRGSKSPHPVITP